MVNSAVGDLPSGYVKIAIENGHRNSGFTYEKWVILHSYVSLLEGTGNGGFLFTATICNYKKGDEE